MTELLLKIFIKNHENVTNPKIREKYGILSGCVGIAVNLLLCIAKFFVGTLTGSIAITGDAVNNLSDAGTSAITVFGFKMSGKPTDKDHPFGHGRIEYITAMVGSFLILLMGVELGKQSIEKIINPSSVTFNLAGAVIIAVSMLGKLWLALFNRKLGKKIDSPAMTAVVADSISDIAATGVTLIALILSAFFPALHIDGWLGILVSLFVLRAGLGIFKETMDALIGQPPTKETVEELEKKVLSYEYVSGIHDLMLHNYGPNRFFGSVHVEMPSDVDPMVSHDIIDNIERDVLKETGINLSIHYDPIDVNNENVDKLRSYVTEVLSAFDPQLTMHDFRVVEGCSHTNLIFDVVVPFKYKLSAEELRQELCFRISRKNPHFFAVINVEHSFV